MDPLTYDQCLEILKDYHSQFIDAGVYDSSEEQAQFEGISQELKPEHRNTLIEFRNAALDAGYMGIAVSFSHIVAAMTEDNFYPVLEKV